ncbi:MAG: restriction endonuclease subunit S [Oscillatoria sp. SIO1A7]|nr:restriction endonuclease subunit S [Oscillatoria sp. SIO1A7]
MRLAPYPEYKDSGVPWLGEIPAHWLEKRAKYFFREVDERSQTGEEEMLSVSHITGVTPRSHKNVTMFKAESNVGDKLCRPGDLVINTMWAWMAAMGISNHAGIVSPSYGVYRPRNSESHDSSYLDRLLRVESYRSEYIYRSTGIRSSRLRLYPNNFLDIKVICPPREEQTQITRFLDWKTAQINKFIRNKRRLIELLKEQKQSIINQAVTRGINPEVRLKPSGVEWIGDIPEHWEVRRIKILFREVDARSKTGEEEHLSMSQKHGGLVRSSQLEERRLMSENYIGGKLCKTGDIVLNRLKAHLGVFALAPCDGVISPDYTVLRPASGIEPLYYERLLRSTAIRAELVTRCKGIVEGFWRLYTNDFYTIRVTLPPRDEQTRINAEISRRLAHIESAISRADREIELIQEYRSRLISDAVTGKIDLRGVEIPEISAEELLNIEEETAEENASHEEEIGDENQRY